MAYSIWSGMLEDVIEIPNDDELKYPFICEATYGARCYPNKKHFKICHYDDVVNKKMNYQELIESKEYIFNADVSSLYPAAMAGCEFMDVKYPTGISEWSTNP